MFMVYTIFICLLLVLTFPLQVVIATINFVFSGKPVFFVQKRIGKNGKAFLMYKFRTMELDAERKQRVYRKLNEADGPVFKIRNDPRFTNFGKWLSHTGLDELPQLINIIKGDMALFGPRPLPVFEAKQLTKKQKKRELILPGILSPWVLNGYHKRSFATWMKSDIEYVQKKTFWYDVRLFFQAVGFMLRLFLREVYAT